jgi:flagellar biosynthesis anti-sigma factor FlgM
MKIDDVLQKMLSLCRNEGADKITETDRKTSNIQLSSAEDTVAISSTIQRLTSAMSYDDLRPVRTDKVIYFRSLIESGGYDVSGWDVAEKMVAMVNKKG